MLRWTRTIRRKANQGDDVAYLQLGGSEEDKVVDNSTQENISLDEEPSTLPRSHLTATRILGWLQVFLPSFLRHSPKAPKILHPTAWLDGLRGIAALFVVFHHCSLLWFDWDLHAGWDGTVTGNNKWFVQLPFIRLMISGPPQVMIFFAISGYALSYKPIKLARQGRFAEVGTALSSSIFRRHSRLFMPAAAVSFLTAIATWLGCFQTYDLAPVAMPSRDPPRFDTLWDQLLHYAWSEVAFTNPIFKGDNNLYDDNLWTLPFEFQCSMVVLIWLVAFTRMPNKMRIMFSVALAWYVEWILIDWALFLFLSGMIVCDVHFEIEKLSSPSGNEMSTIYDETTDVPMWARVRRGIVCRVTNKVFPKQGHLRKSIGLASFIFAIYILSMPELDQGGATSFGYTTMASLIPERFGNDLLVPIAAVWLMFTVDQVNFLQILFTNRFSQYMGRISYPLYLVHGPLLWTWGAFLGKKCVSFIGQDTDGQYVLGIALAASLWWPVVIYVADFTNRFVDIKCVAFIKWAYDKLEKKEI